MLWLVPTLALLIIGIALLARRIRPARSEPEREFEDWVAAALEARFPSAKSSFEGRYVVLKDSDDEAVLPLEGLRERLEHDASRQEYALAHFLAEAGRALERAELDDVEKDHALNAVVPVLLPPERAERTDGRRRYVVRIGAGLHVGFALEDPATGRWITYRGMRDLKLDQDDLLQRSVSNLLARTDGAVVVQDAQPGREVYLIEHADGLNAARVLLRPLWNELSERCGQTLLFCLPSRDRIYAAPADQPESVARMVARTHEDWYQRPHAVSPRIWMWEDGQLQPWLLHA